MIYNRDKLFLIMAEGIDHSTHLKSLVEQQVALSNEIEKKEKLINESHR